MVVPKSLKLNRFKLAKIPHNREIFMRFGQMSGSSFSGDEFAPNAQTKIDQILEVDAENAMKLHEEIDAPE